MKLVAVALLSSVAFSATSFADAKAIQGSDTMFGLMSDAILQAGLEGEVTYAGQGSGKGEEALVNGTQGIAALSRPMKDAAIAKAKAAGIAAQRV
jgi:ABC-type phosphate transport system substrate-binding protein